jgi:NAD+ kinase
MKVAISSLNSRDDSLISKIKKILDDENINSDIIKRSNKMIATDVDIVITAGGDRAILDYSHYVQDFSVPVLGIYESDSTAFLGQIDVSELRKSIGRIKKGDYEIDNVCRLSVNVDGKEVEPVLNDISLFPRKSATLMEYILKINGNDLWHDNSDGVIISTPIGSTAYCMSAGGPMVLQRSQVFVIVPVNSMDNTRRPLIVPNTDKLEIEDILCRYLCEVILDGGKRVAVKKNIVCEKHEFPAKFVRLIKDSPMDIIAKKVKLAEVLLDMPPSDKLFLKTLEFEGE